MEMNLEHSAELSGIALALSKVQSEIKSIKKEASGYGYKYAKVDEIMDYLLPILSKNGLSITQFGDGNKAIVTMIIDSKTGQYIKGRIELPDADKLDMKGVNVAQKSGAIRTYFKRYSICEIVGLTTNDEDNDASSHGFEKPSFPSKSSSPVEVKKSFPVETSPKEDSPTSFRRKKPETSGSDL
jgi:hypothetical protein